MSESGKTNPMDEQTPDAVTEADILIGRIVDGEADEQDRTDFERLADADPLLWRAVATRHQDMASLCDEVDHEIAMATTLELPDFVAPRRAPRWAVALSGWAAVLILAVIWTTMPQSKGIEGLPPARPVQINPDDELTFEQHMQQYLLAPYVMGELDPIVFRVEELPDGRQAIHYVRRIEAFEFLDADEELPVNDKGHLTIDPSELHAPVGPASIAETVH
ncbi:MAG: hypothetical protein JSV91_01145 [Phycisphaerales bacterium]|nr:MAG: hypothetical protein JSV91_01145 [Phycisphaerales bacterium]